MKPISYLGLIPARKGSKGIFNKNLKLLSGKPLIQYTFESAKASKQLIATHLTTDSEEIRTLGKSFLIESPYLRPDYLSTDEAAMIDVVLFHLDWLSQHGVKVENIVLLQPTSPVRSAELIDKAIQSFEKSSAHSLIAVTECFQHPYEMFTLSNNKIDFLVKDLPIRRQEYPKFYFISGALYITSVPYLQRERKFFDGKSAYYITSKEEGVDIDDLLSFRLAESIVNDKQYQIKGK